MLVRPVSGFIMQRLARKVIEVPHVLWCIPIKGPVLRQSISTLSWEIGLWVQSLLTSLVWKLNGSLNAKGLKGPLKTLRRFKGVFVTLVLIQVLKVTCIAPTVAAGLWQRAQFHALSARFPMSTNRSKAAFRRHYCDAIAHRLLASQLERSLVENNHESMGEIPFEVCVRALIYLLSLYIETWLEQCQMARFSS